MPHDDVRHVSFICVTCHVSFICVTCEQWPPQVCHELSSDTYSQWYAVCHYMWYVITCGVSFHNIARYVTPQQYAVCDHIT